MKQRYMITAVVVVMFAGILDSVMLIKHNSLDGGDTTAISCTSKSEPLKSYVNTKYQYVISYPANGKVETSVDSKTSIGTAAAVAVMGSGWSGVAVVAEPQGDGSYVQVTEDQKQALLLDPKSFVEYVRSAEIAFLADSKSAYDANRHPSDIKIMSIGGRQAYGFSIETNADVWPFNNPIGPGGVGAVDYYIVEGAGRQKFVVAYFDGDLVAEKVVESLRFTEATNTNDSNR